MSVQAIAPTAVSDRVRELEDLINRVVYQVDLMRGSGVIDLNKITNLLKEQNGSRTF